jgi:hypothetical protein
MQTNKCHSCGYYFSGDFLRACPRCSQGFSGPIDEHFVTGNSGELGKGIQSKGFRVVAVVAAVILIGAVVGATHKTSTESNSSGDQTSVAADPTSSASDSSSSWIPDGYVAFDVNPEIAYKDGYNAGGCDNPNSNDSTGYCWNYQIVTKAACQIVSATMDLTNGDTSIGQITGEVDNTTAGEPIRLEIDAYDNPDVNDSTSASLSKIICTQ